MAAESRDCPQVESISAEGTVVARLQGKTYELRCGVWLGDWTLMAVIKPDAKPRQAVFEDFTQLKGRLVFAGEDGTAVELPKSAEPTWAEPGSLYRGHTLEEVFGSDRDLLGEELLANPGDPQYDEVAACFPPISKLRVYTFVGTRECFEKVGIFYGGSTPNFDPAVYVPGIEKIRGAGRVLDGLVGGWLPAVRLVYPEKPGDWSELVAYALMRTENGNNRVQPVWYRVSRIEGNTLKWVRYFDSYHPFPPRGKQHAGVLFYNLERFKAHQIGALARAIAAALDQIKGNLRNRWITIR